MSIAKGLSSGYAPIGGSMVNDEIADVIGSAGVFNHGYTYSGHPMSCAVALENLRLLEEEKIVDTVRDDTGPYLQGKWAQLVDHPLVGEAVIKGFMGSIVLTPDKSARAAFASEEGTVAVICRDRCLANGLVMRQKAERMIISPPLIMSRGDIDMLIERVAKSLDETLKIARDKGLMVSA